MLWILAGCVASDSAPPPPLAAVHPSSVAVTLKLGSLPYSCGEFVATEQLPEAQLVAESRIRVEPIGAVESAAVIVNCVGEECVAPVVLPRAMSDAPIPAGTGVRLFGWLAAGCDGSYGPPPVGVEELVVNYLVTECEDEGTNCSGREQLVTLGVVATIE